MSVPDRPQPQALTADAEGARARGDVGQIPDRMPFGGVVLIDPDPEIRARVRRALRARKVRCRTAASLHSAGRALKAARPVQVVVVGGSLLPARPGAVISRLREGDDGTVIVSVGPRSAARTTPLLRAGADDVFLRGGDTARRLVARIMRGLTGDATQRSPDAPDLLRAWMEATEDGVLVVDGAGGVVTCNPAFRQLWPGANRVGPGMPARGILVRSLPDGFSPGSEPATLLSDHTRIVEHATLGLDRDRTVSWSSRPVALDNRVGRIFLFRDVTARVEAEQQARLRAKLLDRLPSAIIATRLDGTIVYWNPCAEQLHGWSGEQVLGSDVRPLLFPPDERRAGIEAIRRLRAGRSWQGEVRLRRADDTTFPALLTLVRLDAEDGRTALILGVTIDLTERRALESRLLQAQKMEAVGTLAGGLAHDFNNLLTGVLGSAALAREFPNLDPAFAELMEMIERAALRGRDLCRQLLSFSRAEEPRKARLDPLEAIEEVVKIVERTFPRSVRLTVEAPEDLPPLLADRSQINQALMNLLVNARDAMTEGGALVVRAEVTSGVPGDDLHLPIESEDVFVRLEVEDSGTGMGAGVMRRMFEPFFTTKGAGRGTGLGLPIVFSVAGAHGGAVRVWSEPGRGSRFALYLPAASGQIGDATAGSEDDDLQRYRGTETVLVVDDEAIVRSVGSRVLAQYGYRTVEAASGTEALRMLADDAEDIAVVLLDIVMPEMEGPEVFRRLREDGHTVPVLLCSGFSVEGIVDRLVADGAAGFVQKPYKIPELLPALRHAIEGRPVPRATPVLRSD